MSHRTRTPQELRMYETLAKHKRGLEETMERVAWIVQSQKQEGARQNKHNVLVPARNDPKQGGARQNQLMPHNVLVPASGARSHPGGSAAACAAPCPRASERSPVKFAQVRAVMQAAVATSRFYAPCFRGAVRALRSSADEHPFEIFTQARTNRGQQTSRRPSTSPFPASRRHTQ
jgi:hypothetical protein